MCLVLVVLGSLKLGTDCYIHRVGRVSWASVTFFPITDAGIKAILNKCPISDRAAVAFVAFHLCTSEFSAGHT